MHDYSEALTPQRLALEDERWQKAGLWRRNAASVKAALVSMPNGTSVCEVGCGTGFVAKALTEEGFNYVGIDRNPGCIDRARIRAPKATFGLQDIRTVNPAEYRSDVVCSFAFLKHFKQEEWRDVFHRILTLGREIAVFDVLISDDNTWRNNGTDWPHLWVPDGELFRILEEERFYPYGSAVVHHDHGQGTEVLFSARRF